MKQVPGEPGRGLRKTLSTPMPRSVSPKPEPARFVAPMKALGTETVPTGKWQCEIKFDGFRAVAVLNDGVASLWSRNRNPLSEAFPAIVEELGRLRCRNAVVDGEIVALDPEGRSRFQLLQNHRDNSDASPVIYYVFDAMHRDGKALVDLPLGDRRRILRSMMAKSTPHVKLSPAFDVEPSELLSVAKKRGLEGIVVKRPGSLYESDRRSGAWLKCKVVAEQEFVIGGFTRPQRSREYFGAILVGYHQGRRLVYAGKVGTGFNRSQLASLHAMFVRARSDACPFSNLPMLRRPRHGNGMTSAEMRKVTWLKPLLVAQIKFAEWTGDGLLRQPVFLGLRGDKSQARVVREAGPVGGRLR
jgi:bifunctional non-homologous end joining protein LigD